LSKIPKFQLTQKQFTVKTRRTEQSRASQRSHDWQFCFQCVLVMFFKPGFCLVNRKEDLVWRVPSHPFDVLGSQRNRSKCGYE